MSYNSSYHKDANINNNEIDYNTNIIFDDDVIQLLLNYFNK